jgi:uncharacterized protein YbcV (DUF1398 family)
VFSVQLWGVGRRSEIENTFITGKIIENISTFKVSSQYTFILFCNGRFEAKVMRWELKNVK